MVTGSSSALPYGPFEPPIASNPGSERTIGAVFHVKHRLKGLSLEAFSQSLRDETSVPVAAPQMRALHAHYVELVKWSAHTSLIGPTTVDTVLRRHYAESLAGLRLIDQEPGTLVDLGSGGGFPGFVLAVMLPNAQGFLVEARQKKWAFLKAASRRARLQVCCVGGRLASTLPEELPEEIDLLTLRAIRLPVEVWRSLVARLSPKGRLVVWMGSREPVVQRAGGQGCLQEVGLTELESIRVPESQRRRIVSYGVEAPRQ